MLWKDTIVKEYILSSNFFFSIVVNELATFYPLSENKMYYFQRVINLELFYIKCIFFNVKINVFLFFLFVELYIVKILNCNYKF